MSTRIAHISDIHFGAVDLAAAAALAQRINDARVDGVIITGDLTQAGRKREFQQAADYVNSLEAPVLIVPGNHDTPVYNLGRRFFDPWGRFQHYITGDLSPVLAFKDVVAVGLNSARRAGLSLDWSLGRLSSRQLDDAARKLRSATQATLKLVAFHHPVLPGPGRAGMALVNQPERALNAFAEAGGDVLLTGHAHVAQAEIHDSAEHRPIIVTAAGTAASTRLRGELPSYNLLSWDGRELKVGIHRYSSNGYATDFEKIFVRHNEIWTKMETQ